MNPNAELEDRNHSYNELVSYLFNDLLGIKRIGNRYGDYVVWQNPSGVEFVKHNEEIISPIPISTGLFTLYFTLDPQITEDKLSFISKTANEKQYLQNIGGIESVLAFASTPFRPEFLPKYGHLCVDYKIFKGPNGISRVHSLQLFR